MCYWRCLRNNHDDHLAHDQVFSVSLRSFRNKILEFLWWPSGPWIRWLIFFARLSEELNLEIFTPSIRNSNQIFKFSWWSSGTWFIWWIFSEFSWATESWFLIAKLHTKQWMPQILDSWFWEYDDQKYCFSEFPQEFNPDFHFLLICLISNKIFKY